MKRLLSIMVGMSLMGAGGALASEPIQLSLTPDIALHGETVPIRGLSLNIWGQNPQEGLALGIVNGSTGSSAGISLALLLNYADSYAGLMMAPVNYVSGDFLGWQGGTVNYTEGSMRGLQTGLVNYAGKLTGLQFGFLNYAESAENGVQIGLVNIIPDNQWFTELPDALAPGMILVNWRF